MNANREFFKGTAWMVRRHWRPAACAMEHGKVVLKVALTVVGACGLSCLAFTGQIQPKIPVGVWNELAAGL